MNLKRALLNIFIVFFLVSSLACAQESINASDLLSRMSSALNFDFKQEDAVKPMVKDYAASIKKIQTQQAADEKYAHVLLRALNQQFDQAISRVLRVEQLNTWKKLKQQILLRVPKDYQK